MDDGTVVVGDFLAGVVVALLVACVVLHVHRGVHRVGGLWVGVRRRDNWFALDRGDLKVTAAGGGRSRSFARCLLWAWRGWPLEGG